MTTVSRSRDTAHEAPLLLRRALGVPLLWKVLIANLVIVTLGAGIGMLVTADFARSRPDAPLVELLAGPLAAAIALSLVVNLIALLAALAPLRRLQSTIEAVRRPVPAPLRRAAAR
jgi:hypothetical protein